MGSEDTLYQDDCLFTGVRYCRADQPNYLQQQDAAVQLKLSEQLLPCVSVGMRKALKFGDNSINLFQTSKLRDTTLA